MVDQNFYNADGELMFVPQDGNLRLVTEFGIIDIEPGEIAVIPRGVKFRVEIPSGPARGYLCENYGGAFTLPERGPIGANCLANSRDFLTPVAAYEDKETPTELYVKWGGSLFMTRPTMFDYQLTLEEQDDSAAALFEMLSSDKLKVDIGQRFALKDARRAHEALESRSTVGATVLEP